jgi:hypothetical protein
MAPAAGDRSWDGLDPAQADGLACVICGRNVLRGNKVSLPVGRSHTGSQVFACVGACAETALAPGAVLIPDQAWFAAGVAFLAALEAAGGDVGRAWPDDLVTATVTAAAPLIVAAELRRFADTAAVRAGGGGHLWLTQGQLRRRAGQLDPAGGGERR